MKPDRLHLHWAAELQDGCLLTEENTPYGEMYAQDPVRFTLVNHAPGELPEDLLSVMLTDGRKLIYRKRSTLTLNGDGSETQSRIIIVGWQETGLSEPWQCLVMIHEHNGLMVMMPRFEAGQEIDLRPWEKEKGLNQATLEAP